MADRLSETDIMMGLIEEHEEDEKQFLSPRLCLLKPIQDIFEAAEHLSVAADAHLAGDRERADASFKHADMQTVGRWTDSIWGPHQQAILRCREVPNAPPTLPKDRRPVPRAPIGAVKRAVVLRDGHHCRFCGIPVIRKEIRELLRAEYPDSIRWGNSNGKQHTAFQCMWLQYDHVLPNGRGGESTVENLIVTCAPCNFGRMERTLEEVGLIDPRLTAPITSKWDGLERINSR